VDGRWRASEGGATFEATSPSTGEVLGTVPEGTREDVRGAIDAANRAWPAWARLSAFDRAFAMRRIVAAPKARRDDLARTLALDQGKPLRAEARDEVEELIRYFFIASEDATRADGVLPPSVDANKRVLVKRVPKGVVGTSPWNWPYTMPAEIVAPALAYGNSVVLAPAPSTSVCAVALAECIGEADLPARVFNLVTGPGPVVGDEVASNPQTRAVGFIGSIATGHRVAERAAGNELLLEMGGNGPLVEEAAADGAEVLVGGKRAPQHGSDLFFEATVVDGVTEEIQIAREETFGPVVPITVIDSEDEAIRIVNGSPYGLLSAVFTADLRRGLRYAEAVRARWVNVNEGTNYWESHLPFGGASGSRSGVGRVGGRFSMDRLTELKTIVIDVS
jgi:acyl-CoA reductase-like NAD-dependent aldehyde dehydrogenase